MNFGMVQTGMLAGLIALVVPYVIHLMFRQKPRDVQMGSVRFLREIMEKHRNRKKIFRWLLMALRMACIALIALMFARPYLNKLTKSDGNERLVVILIDKSASMQLLADGVSLTDEAVSQAKEIVRNASDQTKFEIAFFDHEVHPLTGNDASEGSSVPLTTSQLLNELTSPKQSYSATDYAAAFRWAHDICASSKSDLRQLHVFTDLQQSGLAWSDVEPMPKEVKVNVHDLGRDLPNNIAITGSTPNRLVIRPGDSTSIEVALLNSGPFALEEIPVKLDLKNGSRTIHKHDKVNLEPGSIERVEFELPELQEGVWEGNVSVETIDDLSFDNLRHVAILAKPQYRVLVVDGDDEQEKEFLRETHHLQSALRLAPRGKSYAESPYQVVTESIDAPFENFDAIVLANVARVSEQSADRLQKFVESGGGLVVFGGDRVTASGYESLQDADLIPGKLLDVEEAIDIPWRIESWDKSNSIFAPFNDPQHGDLRQLAFRGLVNLEPSGDANVVAQFADAKPFVIEQSIGDAGGGVVWVTTSCGNQWSNWTQSSMYLPIIHQMLGHLNGLNTGGPLQEALIDTNSESELASFAPGIFREGKFWQVVNVSPRESETERCSIEDFATRFELNVGDQEQGAPAAKVRRATFSSALDVRKNEIWHWILFALVTLGSVEFFLANRTVA